MSFSLPDKMYKSGNKNLHSVRKNTIHIYYFNLHFINFSEFLHFFSPTQLRNNFIIELS